MEHLTEIFIEQLQEALDPVDKKPPVQSLITSIVFNNRITQSELADWLDVGRKTIYNWLTRMEERDLRSAFTDTHRAGRENSLQRSLTISRYA